MDRKLSSSMQATLSSAADTASAHAQGHILESPGKLSVRFGKAYFYLPGQDRDINRFEIQMWS